MPTDGHGNTNQHPGPADNGIEWPQMRFAVRGVRHDGRVVTLLLTNDIDLASGMSWRPMGSGKYTRIDVIDRHEQLQPTHTPTQIGN